MTKTFIACVGPTEKEFIIYTEIAKRSSKFFQAALSRDWKETHDNRVTLAEVQTDLFESYLQWLNTSVITSSFPIGMPSMIHLAELYILGDFLDDTDFRNAVLDDITAFAYDMWPGICCVKLAWEKTPKDSPLRAMILEIWARKPLGMVVEKLVSQADEYPGAFMAELFAHMAASDMIELAEACCKRHFVRELREFRKGLGNE